MNFRRKTFVHGTVERSLLKNLPVRMIGRERDMDFRGKRDYPPRRVLRHLLLHRHSHTAQINSEVLRLNSHCRADACGEGGGNEICRRESFTFALVVARRVRRNF